MRIGVLRKLRTWVVGALALAMSTVMVVPANAVQARGANGPGAIETPQGAGTVSHKAVGLLAKVLRSPGMPRMMNFLLRNQATEQQIGLVVRYAASTAKILEQVTKWDQIVLATVRAEVHGGLVKLGVVESNASSSCLLDRESVGLGPLIKGLKP